MNIWWKIIIKKCNTKEFSHWFHTDFKSCIFSVPSKDMWHLILHLIRTLKIYSCWIDFNVLSNEVVLYRTDQTSILQYHLVPLLVSRWPFLLKTSQHYTLLTPTDVWHFLTHTIWFRVWILVLFDIFICNFFFVKPN